MSTDTEKQVTHLYRQITEISGIYHNMISHTGITDNEFWIWYSLIVIGGEQSQQDICSAWAMSKQTVNTIIRHMTEKGFAYLEPAAGSGKRKIIRLTESGCAYGEKLISPVKTVENRTFAKIGIDELTVCAAGFEKFITALREEAESEAL